MLDRRFQMRPPLPAGDDIVLVAIDDTSLQFIGRWPWRRSTHAELLNRLTDAGATVVAFDVVFSEPSVPEEDRALARAMARSGRVVLPVFVPPAERHRAITSTTVLYPIPKLEKAAAALGHIGLAPDSDGRFRWVRLYVVTDPVHDSTLPACSVGAVCRYLGIRSPSLERGTERKVALDKGHVLYTGGRGRFLCNYFGGAAGTGRRIREVKYVQALYGNLPDDTFRNKLVVVGATARGIGEQYFSTPIPADEGLSGAEVHANAMETLL